MNFWVACGERFHFTVEGVLGGMRTRSRRRHQLRWGKIFDMHKYDNRSLFNGEVRLIILRKASCFFGLLSLQQVHWMLVAPRANSETPQSNQCNCAPPFLIRDSIPCHTHLMRSSDFYLFFVLCSLTG